MADDVLHASAMARGKADPERTGSVPVSAVVGATLVGLGGAIGAVLVLPVRHGLDWLHWPLGATVGVAAMALGARGQRAGMVVALLGFVAMIVGRTLVLHLALQGLWQDLSRLTYEMTRIRARELAALPAEVSDRRIKEFMADNGYAEERQDPDRVTDQQLAEFLQRTAPMLRTFAAQPPTLDAWLASDPPLLSGTEKPRLIDVVFPVPLSEILFVLLGMSTAYVLVKHGRWQPVAFGRMRET